MVSITHDPSAPLIQCIIAADGVRLRVKSNNPNLTPHPYTHSSGVPVRSALDISGSLRSRLMRAPLAGHSLLWSSTPPQNATLPPGLIVSLVLLETGPGAPNAATRCRVPGRAIVPTEMGRSAYPYTMSPVVTASPFIHPSHDLTETFLLLQFYPNTSVPVPRTTGRLREISTT